MAALNTMKTINECIGEINPYYDMKYMDIITILKNSYDDVDIVCNAFRFGYAQATKATLAELKKKERGI